MGIDLARIAIPFAVRVERGNSIGVTECKYK